MDNDINSVFWLSLATMSCTFFSLALRYCYKSKCKDVDICCIKIKRDIETEYKEDINNIDSIRLESPLNKSNSK